jgi:hypothetical protein
VECHPEHPLDQIFQLPLVSRHGGNIVDVELKDGRSLTFDRLPATMSLISSLKPGDVVVNPVFGPGVVLGERGGSLVIKYKTRVRLLVRGRLKS